MVSQPAVPGAALLPWPRQLEWGQGNLQLTCAAFQPRQPVSNRLSLALQAASRVIAGRSVLPLTAGPATDIALTVNCSSDRYPGLETSEAYLLEVSARGIELQAENEFGLLRAVTTLAQLVSADGRLPWLRLADGPRFPWRGLLLDCARHFLPVPSIERTLRAMALCKLNVLHLHLTDDQAFRLPSRAFPKLPSPRHYSVAQLQGLVELAADLGIRIVPELDMPGHVTSWLTAYPEWGSQPVAATRRFGVHPACLDPTREVVYAAIDQLLVELTEIFPDQYVHIGGDEVHPLWWSEDPAITNFMRERSMSDVRDLQAYFNGRVGELVEAHGRQVVAWDEVLHARLPAHWLVQAWRGATARDRLLQHGNRVVMSAPYYLDLHYPMDVYYQFDPAAAQARLVALEDAMLEDPRLRHVADGMRWTQQWRQAAVDLPAVPEEGLVGAEACLWGELVDERVLDQRLWSRLPALAERFWSEVDADTAASLYPRAEVFRKSSLPSCGIDLDAQLRRALNGLGLDESWQQIARLLEPVKWYGRLLGEQALAARLAGSEMPQARPYDADVPLTGLADVLPPESLQWRQLDELIVACDGDVPAADKTVQNLLQRLRAAVHTDTPPAALAVFLEPLAGLADLLEARLGGSCADEPELDAIMVPRGELMLALSPRLRSWLLGQT